MNLHWVSALSAEARRKQRERDKTDFLEWFWLGPLAGGLAGDVGLDELERLGEFAKAIGLIEGHSRHAHKRLEEAIEHAVEDDLIIPVIDRADESGSCVAAATARTSVRFGSPSSDAFSPLLATLGGDPILPGPYDPATQEEKLKAAREAVDGPNTDRGGFDWLGAAEAAASALLGSSRSNDDSDSTLKNFGDSGDDADNSLLSDAQPYEYVPDALGSDALELAAQTNNPDYAARMLGYDRDTFGDMIHAMKNQNGLRGDNNVVWHDNGDVYYKGMYLDNMHNY
ncbi:hypothetical protein BYI23_C009320 [Burkholderia sp. YI23]|nr:hypothetical protein BYI23_C009320 [Burkholderia sp. YI23]